MSSGIKSLGIAFYVSVPTEVVVVPEAKNITNNFDLLSSFVSLKRLPGENNTSYKQRIMDVNVHLGGPTYEGNINNITRELGYTRENCILIELKLNSSGDQIAENPRVDILANKVVLYSNYQPNGTETIDKEIRIYNPEDEGYFLSDLVTEINSSNCFSASIYSNVRPNLHSCNLIQKSSYNYVNNDLINSSKKILLSAENIVQESLRFGEEDIFQTEVIVTPSSEGEYLVDYQNGEIETFSLPNGTYEVSYHYNEFPLTVDYSPIQIYSLQDENFKKELFLKETLDSGETVSTLPTSEGSEVIHQLFLETQYLWGE